MEETIKRIKEYLGVLNHDVSDENLLNFVIAETLERVQLYLNSEVIPKKTERIIANVINTALVKIANEGTGVEQAVSSISDNGQSISYTNEARNYFATATDNELFSGFAPLLNRYRRVKVVHS